MTETKDSLNNDASINSDQADDNTNQIEPSKMQSSVGYCCSICLDDDFDNKFSALRCGHVFHTKCINNQFRFEKRCPLCKKRIKRKNGDVIEIFQDFIKKLAFSSQNSENVEQDSPTSNTQEQKLSCALDILHSQNENFKEKIKDLKEKNEILENEIDSQKILFEDQNEKIEKLENKTKKLNSRQLDLEIKNVEFKQALKAANEKIDEFQIPTKTQEFIEKIRLQSSNDDLYRNLVNSKTSSKASLQILFDSLTQLKHEYECLNKQHQKEIEILKAKLSHKTDLINIENQLNTKEPKRFNTNVSTKTFNPDFNSQRFNQKQYLLPKENIEVYKDDLSTTIKRKDSKIANKKVLKTLTSINSLKPLSTMHKKVSDNSKRQLNSKNKPLLPLSSSFNTNLKIWQENKQNLKKTNILSRIGNENVQLKKFSKENTLPSHNTIINRSQFLNSNFKSCSSNVFKNISGLGFNKNRSALLTNTIKRQRLL